jgi:menaquinone-specific isochorismate synthase
LFILPRYLLTDLGGQVWLTVNCVGEADGEDAESAALNDVFHLVETHHSKRNGHHAGSASQLTPNYLTGHKEWANMVTEATTRIGRGELQKVVLARAAEVNAQQPIDPLAALGALGERYSACHRFLIEPAPGHAFFGATPELLAQVDGDHIATAALAGSTRRGESAEEDAALGRALLANPKERHEHALVVDSIRDSLADLTDELRVDAEPSPRHLHNIQHLHTGIDGTLAAGVDALDVVEALHPTPALGGSPRDAALDLIARLEGQGRGWYGGPVGWLDAEGNGTFVVAIRSAVSAGNTARLYAGAGIVGDSQPDAEWQETALKFRPLLEALTPSPSPSGRGEQNGGEA